MLDWKYIDGYVKEAIKHFLAARSESIEYLSSDFVTGSRKDYIAYFKDNKLTKWYWNAGIAKQGVFKVVISEKVLSMQTSGIDIAAKIPSNIEEEKRVMLRIAYYILICWQNAVLEAYRIAENDHSKITLNNAIKWYKELK